MKKFLIFSILVAGISNVLAQENYTYSPAYISHMRNCSPYTDEYTVDIPTDDSISPYLKVKSTEEIVGWLNGNCITKSTVYSLDYRLLWKK